MGVRGPIGEAGVQQMTAVNLAGIHHQKGQGWEEPLNAPNPLYVAVKGVSLPENADRLILDFLPACDTSLYKNLSDT